MRMKGLYKISRPLTTLTGALAVVMGGYVAKTGAWDNIVLATIVTILISSSANAWNDYQDIEIDRVNQPNRPLPAGIITPKDAIMFSFVLSILALILVSFINQTAFIIAFASIILLYVYSWRLKSTILLGNLSVAIVSGLSAIFGGVAAGNAAPAIWLAWIIGIGIMGREILKTLADYEGDLQQHCRTIATAWGKKPAKVLVFVFLILMCIVMIMPFFANIYKPIYAYIVVLGVFPVVLYIIINVSRVTVGAHFERLSQIMKYDFLIWFVAVIFGSAG